MKEGLAKGVEGGNATVLFALAVGTMRQLGVQGFGQFQGHSRLVGYDSRLSTSQSRLAAHQHQRLAMLCIPGRLPELRPSRDSSSDCAGVEVRSQNAFFSFY